MNKIKEIKISPGICCWKKKSKALGAAKEGICLLENDLQFVR